MGHRVIIIDSISPPPGGASVVADHEPSEVKVRVEYRPSHDLTPAQVGHEITRMVKLIDKIEGGED